MISKIHLSNFRSFENKVAEFAPGITVIVGPNAVGKTNLLESVYLLSTGKSFKAAVGEEMIKENEDIARVKGKLTDETLLEIMLTRGEINIGDSHYEKAPRKKLMVNGVSKRLIDFAGKLKVVLFAPQDLDLVTESPSIRRKFLDTAITLTDREYHRAVLSYEKGLRQRNKLLFRIREEGLSRSQLLFWDKLLIKNGDYISSKREEFIGFINSTPSVNDEKFSLVYDKSSISEARIAQYANEEIAAATTLVGPHRDDFLFEKQGRNLSSYGSRGEQRMGVLWVKLAELFYIEEVTKIKPTLLLDDIFSELDHKHRDQVFELAAKQQTIITTADPHFLEGIKIEKTIEL